MELDLSVFLAAVVENAGGEIRLPFDTFAEFQTGTVEKALTFDIVDEGATILIGLTDEIPEDAEAIDND